MMLASLLSRATVWLIFRCLSIRMQANRARFDLEAGARHIIFVSFDLALSANELSSPGTIQDGLGQVQC